MFRNYLKIAWRNLLKHKVFSFINISGLAIGISACLLIIIYVHHETNYDQYNKNADRIARITMVVHTPESDLVIATTSAPLATALVRDYPEVQSAARFENDPQIIKYKNEFIREENFYSTDQHVFEIFSFEFLEGRSEGSLNNPKSIILTQSMAKKYFGTEKALGKTISKNDGDLMVTGVIRDRPANSDLKIDALLSEDFSKTTRWTDDFSIYTFVLFKKKPDLNDFGKKISELGAKYIIPEFNADGQYKVTLEAEMLKDVHFSKNKLADRPKGNRQFNTIFSLLAVFILIIAMLNYINLSTAKSADRAREVGIRKVSGAGKFQLIRQFLFESFLIVTISWLIALGIVQLILPWFNQLTQTTLTISWSRGTGFSVLMLVITLVLAGIYPALVLSGFKPITVLKGNWKMGSSGIVLRKTITITQFAIAAALILCTLVIYSQMKFIREKDLGLNKDQLLAVYMPDDSSDWKQVSAFQDALRRRPEIADLTVGARMTVEGLALSSVVVNSQGKRRELMSNIYQIDPHYLNVFGIKLAEGRNLSDSFADKKENFLVNEAFVKSMGWESGLGKDIEAMEQKGKVVGVVKNFYYKSLHNMVEPLIMFYNKNPAYNTATIKIKPADLNVVKNIYQEYLAVFK